MATMRINGADLAYDEAGNGPAVVLVHAGCADRRMWEHQFQALKADFRVVRYDWRGYGESADAIGDFAHHEDLLALMDALEIGRAAVVGSSDGGKIGLDAALTAPGRITSLTLVAPGVSGHEWPSSMTSLYRERVHDVVGLDRLRLYRTGEAETIDPAELDAYCEAETEFLVAGPSRTRDDLDPEVWKAALAMDRRLNQRAWSRPQPASRTAQPPAITRLHEIKIPTLVVTGLADVPGILALSDLLVESIKGVRRIELPRTGHLPPLERPNEFNAALLGFLQELESAGHR
ncbi:alpha/beta fold hydrolase [Streptosporangium sp. 'caverna']|uniref:alpha/beta fold hydrolase n=1 Tax=Streptosporangium sp. 'caverna' TaxID=2202249 RepID=UPI000D7E3C0A|nr:alpha/beta hydrolase [Streptosporangium sp. 'caverna']AWS47776.1 alpha/beta hydrolase [Streptosporangium sp. 'caverna']